MERLNSDNTINDEQNAILAQAEIFERDTRDEVHKRWSSHYQGLRAALPASWIVLYYLGHSLITSHISTPSKAIELIAGLGVYMAVDYHIKSRTYLSGLSPAKRRAVRMIKNGVNEGTCLLGLVKNTNKVVDKGKEYYFNLSFPDGEGNLKEVIGCHKNFLFHAHGLGIRGPLMEIAAKSAAKHGLAA